MNIVTLGRPLAATLLLGGLLAVAGIAVGASWADLSSAVEERDAKADLLARSVAAGQRARLAPPAERRGEPFIVAETGTLAAARLDAMVRDTAADAECSLLSSRAELKRDEGGTGDRIEAQAVVEGLNEALQALLLRLETGAPTVLVDELSIEPAAPADAASGDPQAPRLRMSLTLSAFWKGKQR